MNSNSLRSRSAREYHDQRQPPACVHDPSHHAALLKSASVHVIMLSESCFYWAADTFGLLLYISNVSCILQSFAGACILVGQSDSDLGILSLI